jgi:type IV pilus assembly protein PilC
MPVFGDLFAKIALTRFSRNLGTLLSSGVPILAALDIVSTTTGSKVIEKAVYDVRQSVATGESIAAPLARHPVFPPMVVQMMAVGEETGAIDEMLDKIADFYDQEVEATVNALTSLIEPILIVVMGVVIGGMIIALYLPMFDVINLIK